MIAQIIDGDKDYHYYMDPTIYKIIVNELTPSLNRKDKDLVFIVDGREGSGKSVWTMQFSKVLYPGLSVASYCFTPEEFEAAIKNAKRGEVIVFDEAFRGYSSRSVLSKVNKVLFGMIQEIRQLNLCIILVVPSFFSLDREISIRRANGLFHVFEHPKYKTFRMWAYYDYNKKQYLYDYGKKNFNYKVCKPLCWGKFFDYYTIDEAAYRLKKRESLIGSFEPKRVRGINDDKWEGLMGAAMFVMHKDLKLTFDKIFELYSSKGVENFSRSQMHKLYKAFTSKVITK